MSWTAVIVGGASILGGALASNSAKSAANKSAEGSQASINEARRQFDIIQGNTATSRAIGDQALNALGSIYGYKPANQFYGPSAPAGMTPAQAPQIADDGFLNKGAGSILNPWTVTGKLGSAGKILDPLGGVFGNLFGNKHGDEKRNYEAFFRDNEVYDLGNGKYALADGTTFDQSQLKDVAGTWYGATYAPDGGQDEWQQRWTALQGRLGKTPMGTQAGAPGGTPTNALTGPDYTEFFKSPDYNFQRTEGTRGIERSAAARGGAFSGNALRALTEFNSNLAKGSFGNYFNRQTTLAGLGSAATSDTNNAGLITSGRVGNALQDAGDARASGVVGSANAWGSALSGLGNAAGYYFGNRNQDPSGIGYFKPTVRRV